MSRTFKQNYTKSEEPFEADLEISEIVPSLALPEWNLAVGSQVGSSTDQMKIPFLHLQNGVPMKDGYLEL